MYIFKFKRFFNISLIYKFNRFYSFNKFDSCETQDVNYFRNVTLCFYQ